ncbi:MAG TPA: glycosyltransferase family 39 protein [Anaerolineales bacterium]|nr:glycosyltransferase family 39 protein [Anaerolineales bacterium]
MSQPTFFSSRSIRIAAFVLLFVSAFAIRLYDLTDPPLDFHPTRQLLSAIKARALYFKTRPPGIPAENLETGIRQAKLKAQVEPVILEQLVAYTYRFSGEQLWVARIYSSLFWLIGGVFLFLLVRDLLSFDAAIFSTAYYLFFPYAIIASRSFQPDPLMVMFIVAFWWAFARWINLAHKSSLSRKWEWITAVFAGILGGAAILIKFSAAFFVIGAALGLAFSRFTWRELFRNGQVWLMAVLGALPGLIYLLYGLFIEGGLGGQFSGRFVPALLVDPFNYLQWMTRINLAAGGVFVMLALLGFFLTGDKQFRSLLFGLWGAYLIYSLIFNYHAATHDYYQLPFIPIVAVSLAPLGGWFFARLAESTFQRYQRSAAYVILLFGLFTVLWNVRNLMKAVDYRPEAAMWAEVGELIEDKSIIALTENYGSQLEYWGWRTVPIWPYTGDPLYARIQEEDAYFEKLFSDYSSRKDFFLVTDLDEFSRQTQLRERLNDFPVFMEGDGFLIFSLRNP